MRETVESGRTLKGKGYQAANILMAVGGERVLALGWLAAVSRIVTPATLGEFSLIVALVAIVHGLAADGWLRSIGYFVPRGGLRSTLYESGRKVVLRAGGVGLVGAVVGVGVIVLVEMVGGYGVTAEVNSVAPMQRYLWIGGGCILYWARQFVGEVLYAIGAGDWGQKVESVVSLAGRIALLVVFVAPIAEIVGLLVGYFGGIFVGVAAGGWKIVGLRTGGKGGAQNGKEVSWRGLVEYSLPLLGAGGISILLAKVDYILLGVLSEREEVGFLRIALSTAAICTFVASGLKRYVKPEIVRIIEAGGIEKAKDIHAVTRRWVYLTTMPIGAVLIGASQEVLNLVYSGVYVEANDILVVLVIGNMLTIAGGFQAPFLEAVGATRALLESRLMALVVNIALAVLLIPKFGAMGAAVGTTAGIAFSSAFEVYVLNKEMESEVWCNSLSQYLLAALVGCACTAGVSHVDFGLLTPLISGGFGVMVFYLAVGLLKGYRKSDTQAVMRYWKPKRRAGKVGRKALIKFLDWGSANVG